MMQVYHIYIDRDGTEKWIAIGLISDEQAKLLGQAFPDITKIETWLGAEVYQRRTVR